MVDSGVREGCCPACVWKGFWGGQQADLALLLGKQVVGDHWHREAGATGLAVVV